MAHHVHPKGFRLRKMEDWSSRGFYQKKQAKFLEEDFKIRSFLEERLKRAGVEKIEIERFLAQIKIIIFTSRPGLVIGRRGEEVERLRNELEKMLIEKKDLSLEIRPVKDPWLSASLVAQWMAQQIEKRMPYRRVLKGALRKIMTHKEVEGARVEISGRLDGVKIARTEWLKTGKLPRQTLRADIDYAEARAYCTYGVVGIKVWIYKGEKLE